MAVLNHSARHKRVEESVVRAVAEPAFTETWHPVSHAKVLDSLEVAVNEAGLAITDRDYTLNTDGRNMFGTWGLLDSGDNPDIGWQIGFRNSVSGTYAVGLTAGTKVFVCSNMCFSGEYIVYRRHTKQMDEDELRRVTGQAVDSLLSTFEDRVNWQIGLKDHPIDNDTFKTLTYDAMDRGAFSPGKFTQFLQCHEEELELAKEQNLYTFHSAGTRLMRDQGLFQLSNQTTVLNSIADDYILQVAA